MSAKKTATPCLGCMYADWDTTAAGRLHPDGAGQCTWVHSITLPMSMPSWGLAARDFKDGIYTLRGGRIERWKSKFTIGERTCPVRQEPIQ